MKAWVYQDSKQVKKHGPEKARWYVGWVDPDGGRCCQSCGPGGVGKKAAEKLKDKLHAQLVTGTYQSAAKKTWKEFRQEYEARVLGGLAPRTREEVVAALDHFERVAKPNRMAAVTSAKVADFAADRRKEAGKKRGALVSPATVNKELRHLRAAFGLAVEWKYLPALPKFRMEKEPKKLPRFMLSSHFAAVYQACESAKFPANLPYPAAEWWRALLVTGYMTGWRIGDMLNLRRADLDLDACTAVIRWASEGNKGKRDELVPLHPVVV